MKLVTFAKPFNQYRPGDCLFVDEAELAVLQEAGVLKVESPADETPSPGGQEGEVSR
jgi:hypothetical protein